MCIYNRVDLGSILGSTLVQVDFDLENSPCARARGSSCLEWVAVSFGWLSVTRDLQARTSMLSNGWNSWIEGCFFLSAF